MTIFTGSRQSFSRSSSERPRLGPSGLVGLPMSTRWRAFIRAPLSQAQLRRCTAHSIVHDRIVGERGLRLYFNRPDKECSLTDCLSFTAMSEEGLTETLTGDRHFEQAGFTALPQDFARLTSWLDARHHEQWTRQMDQDAAAGRLDFLFEAAGVERAAGQLPDWPPAKP